MIHKEFLYILGCRLCNMLLRMTHKLALAWPRRRVGILKGKKEDENDKCEVKEEEEEEKGIIMMAVVTVIMMNVKLVKKIKKMRRRI